MNKKLISMGTAVLTVVSLAAAPVAVSASEGSDKGDHILSVYAWDANFNIPALKAAEADYRANVDPEFELNILEQSGSSDVENAVTLAASAGDFSQLPDIVLFQDHWIQKFVADYPDAWTPIDDIDIDWSDFGEEKLSYSIIDGVHYGVPVDNGTAVFAYRVDLLEECGYTLEDMTGCTWDDFIEVGKAVYEKTGKYLLSINADANDLPYMMLQAEGSSQFKDGEPYITENETLVRVIEKLVEMVQNNVLYLGNDWTEYTDQTIVGDRVAGVMNGNWIIPTIEQVAENSGKWEITTLPTLDGGREGYAANGGSSLYVTANCKNPDLAKDFLTKTFGGSTATYDAALTDGGVITCCISAGQSDIYNQGVDYFNGQPIYNTIVEMGTHVEPIEQNDFHYTCRGFICTAIQQILEGANVEDALADAESQLRFAMGL